jgi:hypothetical protein
MIHYDLTCNHGHDFDGWFPSSAAFDSQAEHGLVACSVCGSAQISKQLMAPGIASKANKKDETPRTMVAGPVDPRMQMMMQMMREMRKSVEANAEYVGPKFADEARKIHYQETEKRGIYGEATPHEAEALIEEGIAVHPLPRLPEDGN